MSYVQNICVEKDVKCFFFFFYSLFFCGGGGGGGGHNYGSSLLFLTLPLSVSSYLCRDKAESSIDIFASVIEDLYQRADSEARGYVNWKMFKQLLLSAEMSPFLQEQDVKDMQEQFKSSVPNGKATFGQFRSLARELILRVYRAKDPSDVRRTHTVEYSTVGALALL